eukprot:Trichotokara_eunicae@DN6170_c0_g1_i2.p2
MQVDFLSLHSSESEAIAELFLPWFSFSDMRQEVKCPDVVVVGERFRISTGGDDDSAARASAAAADTSRSASRLEPPERRETPSDSSSPSLIAWRRPDAALPPSSKESDSPSIIDSS